MRGKTVLRLVPMLLLLWLPDAWVQAEESVHGVRQLTDLRQDAQLAAERQLPILLLFSTDSCEFCALIKQDYLGPMQNNAAYDRKVIIREVPTSDYHYLRDLDGELIGGDDLALRYGADLVPTVILIDSRGRQLTQPLVGFNSRHYYDRTLEARINAAVEKLRKFVGATSVARFYTDGYHGADSAKSVRLKPNRTCVCR